MQVTDQPTPKLADIKRQLLNTAHELEELGEVPGNDQKITDSIQQSLYRVREAITHIDAAEKAKG